MVILFTGVREVYVQMAALKTFKKYFSDKEIGPGCDTIGFILLRKKIDMFTDDSLQVCNETKQK